MIHIVGLGPGSMEYILPKAVAIMKHSEIILGFRRALDSISFINIQKVEVKNLDGILDFINLNKSRDISVIASGDPCFYGILDYIRRNYKESIKVIPGISSFQYLMAKLNKPWQGSFIGSLHGREEEFLKKVESNYISIWLTDKTNNPKSICIKLKEGNFTVKVYIGENLSYKDEKITIGMPEELINNEYSNLSVVVIENDLYKG